MGLGPRLDLRQSQSLVMTQQLQAGDQAARHVSNLELDAFIAEELVEEPLARGASARRKSENAVTSRGHAEPAKRRPTPSGADESCSAKGDDERPLDMDWREAKRSTMTALRRRGVGGASDEAFDFDRV